MSAKSKRPAGRPPAVLTDRQLEFVRRAASMGVPAYVIAGLAGISPNTLRQLAGEQIELGAGEIKGVVEMSVVKQARKGSMRAAEFYLSRRYPAEWSARQTMLLGGASDAPPIATVNMGEPARVVVVLPHNDREPPAGANVISQQQLDDMDDAPDDDY
jgi:hypothetical protein